MYRILTFDGGGIRGLVTLALLKKLEAQVPALLARTDLLAGTSTGGIIALGLAAGMSVDDLISLYRDKGKEIFDDGWWDNLRDAGGLCGADYDQKNLEKILRGLFPRTRLRDLGKRVLIPTFDLDNEAASAARRTWRPKFFHNYPGNGSDEDEPVVDVALRTSAAPTYFPSYDGFIDGGMVANNPSMAALTQALDTRTDQPPPELAEICLLSLGTGTNLSFIKGRTLDWGLGQWAKPLITLLMDASTGIADYQCRQILRGAYRRIAPVFPASTNIKLDDWKRADELLAFGRAAPLVDTWDDTDVVSWLTECGW
ncbi:MAG TPA: patatin-like phospholipase family protein [Lacunisphaera sp.]